MPAMLARLDKKRHVTVPRPALREDRPDLYAPAWERYAACREYDIVLFFPAKGESAKEAKRVCGGCGVRTLCLEKALSYSSDEDGHGVFGGLAPAERDEIRAARGMGVAA